MSKPFLHSQDVIGLLSKLKDTTPDYPADLLAARKAAFLQQAIAITITGSGLAGKGGGDGGLGGSAGTGGPAGTGGSGILGGMSAAQTVLLQAVIGVWVIAAMLTAAYVFRDQIIDLLQDYGVVEEMTQAPSNEPVVLPSIPPATEVPTTAFTSTPGVLPENEAAPEDPAEVQATPDDAKDNPGLHLGQTPGAPEPPNQDKPDKPGKQEQPGKTDKTSD